MTNVRHEIQKLAAEFAENVVGKLRHVLNNEFLGGSAGGSKPHLNGASQESPRAGRPRNSGRLHRTAEDIQALSDKIVELLKQSKDGMRAEAIREALSIERREWQKPLSIAIETGKIAKSGEKRATVYTAAGASSATPKNGKSTKTKKKTKGKGKQKSAKKAAKFKGGGKSKKAVPSIRDSMPPSPLDEGEDEAEESGSDDEDA
jgi:hypothetical protein